MKAVPSSETSVNIIGLHGVTPIALVIVTIVRILNTKVPILSSSSSSSSSHYVTGYLVHKQRWNFIHKSPQLMLEILLRATLVAYCRIVMLPEWPHSAIQRWNVTGDIF
jgi:predicted membrane protein